MLTILPSSSTRAILLTSLAIYYCILKAIQYYRPYNNLSRVVKRVLSPKSLLFQFEKKVCNKMLRDYTEYTHELMFVYKEIYSQPNPYVFPILKKMVCLQIDLESNEWALSAKSVDLK